MKKLIFAATIAATSFAFAQTGKMGVNTSAPTETLHVNGTVRISSLPASGSGTIYNGAASQSTTFNATKTVVADANGVLGTVNSTPFLSQTKCVLGVSSDGFADNTDYARIDFPNYSFVWRSNNGSGAVNGNRTLAINNQATTDHGITKSYGGDPSNIGGSFHQFDPGSRVEIATGINWDSEQSGEYIFYTEKNLAYRIVYWTQKRISTSVPSFCWNITRIN